MPPCTIEPSSSWCNSMYPRPVVSTFFHLLRAQEGCSVRCLDSIDYSIHMRPIEVILGADDVRLWC